MISLYDQDFCLLKEKNTQLCSTLKLQCQPGFHIVRGIGHNPNIVGWIGKFPSLVKRFLLRPTHANGSPAF